MDRNVLAALKEEMLRWIELFVRYEADDLEEYNRVAAEPLKPIVCIANEFNDLLEIEAIENDAQSWPGAVGRPASGSSWRPRNGK